MMNIRHPCCLSVNTPAPEISPVFLSCLSGWLTQSTPLTFFPTCCLTPSLSSPGSDLLPTGNTSGGSFGLLNLPGVCLHSIPVFHHATVIHHAGLRCSGVQISVHSRPLLPFFALKPLGFGSVQDGPPYATPQHRAFPLSPTSAVFPSLSTSSPFLFFFRCRGPQLPSSPPPHASKMALG
eukprot:GGOE01033304.1.p1 GENE.GGOE01033304.1~~GGOE01033304.1.p1  ORF type:complete len:180 (+),score=1.93 GGOE01033304.1:416-955(+)